MLLLYCSKRKSTIPVPVEVCLFNCPKGTKAKCTEYTKFYEQILQYTIEQKYIDKYGDPELPIPLTMRKRRKKRG